ncbi:MAG: 50S ribosomal protein L6 [Deltaproteobacteria bacterium]|nr:50S ribosomal protein L6 [Deltaproteobacteria bacterium]
MSRVGKKPIALPPKVQIDFKAPRLIVKGPKGELSLDVHPEIGLETADSELQITRPSDNRRHRALHGMVRSLVQNMVVGVSAGFQKELEIQGIGYRANLQGSTLTLSLGFSHPVNYAVPKDVQVEVRDQRVIAVKGIDRQKVGQVAAEIRGFKPPEPYKGTGIRYVGERIARKEGKTGAK